MVHFVNLFFSIFYGEATGSDACAWYFTSVLIDTTAGVLINWILLQIVQKLIGNDKHKNLNSGDYFIKNEVSGKFEVSYSDWAKQT